MKSVEKNKENQKGQIALIIILLMVVVGTLALSVVSRSVTDIGISKQDENKIRAFSKAEAGIEDILNAGAANVFSSGPIGTGNINGDTSNSYNYSVSALGDGSSYELQGQLENGETTQINLNNNTGNINLYWVDTNNSVETTTPKAALEVSVFTDNSGVYSVDRTVYKPTVGGGGPDSFESVGSPPGAFGTKTYDAYKSNIAVNSNVKFIRVKALYNKTSLAVEPDGFILPAQAYKITVKASDGSNNAALEVIQTVSAAAGIFDYSLWSGSGLTKSSL
jgi:Tfp pilus assembly protein PilX